MVKKIFQWFLKRDVQIICWNSLFGVQIIHFHRHLFWYIPISTRSALTTTNHTFSTMCCNFPSTRKTTSYFKIIHYTQTLIYLSWNSIASITEKNFHTIFSIFSFAASIEDLQSTPKLASRIRSFFISIFPSLLWTFFHLTEV